MHSDIFLLIQDIMEYVIYLIPYIEKTGRIFILDFKFSNGEIKNPELISKQLTHTLDISQT